MPKRKTITVKPEWKNASAEVWSETNRNTGKPFWGGPEEEGLTQSMLDKFITCRERFRIKVVLGLQQEEEFRKNIEFGNMWHICEEALGNGLSWEDTQELLSQYVAELMEKFPMQRDEVHKWHRVCLVAWPNYVAHWKLKPGARDTKMAVAERNFEVPYAIPDGRVVTLRGKWDGIHCTGTKNRRKVVLQENKTKGEIDQVQITEQLNFDKQTMFYLCALSQYIDNGDPDDLFPPGVTPASIRGVLYNVIKRPLSGGKGTIRQHKPTKAKPSGESEDEFYNRLNDEVIEPNREEFFSRWDVDVTYVDITKFRMVCLDPLLTQVCDWWEWVSSPEGIKNPCSPEGGGIHWVHPYGCYNAVDQQRPGPVDEYVKTGSMMGLERVKTLFPELEETTNA